MEPLPENLPSQVPEPGFYYHYKHDPVGSFDNYAYEVIAVGHHTEEDCRPEDSFLIIYRPLYEDAYVYRMGKQLTAPVYDVRPLAMFMETVTKDGVTQPRFVKITDTAVIELLQAKRDQLYGYRI